MRSDRSAGRRGPQPIAQVMAELASRRGLGRVAAVEQFCEHWEEAVGAALASQTRPVRLSRGVLEVVVSGSVVLQELVFRKEELLRKMRGKLPQATIREIRFRLGALE